MKWILPLCGLTMLFCSCAPTPPPPPPAAATQPVVPIAMQPVETEFSPSAGPTTKARVPGGYELSNHQYRVVINETNGDVSFWGYPDKARNMVFHRGIYATLSALPDASPRGYIEQRDEETWQFMGDDDNHITWRKIYCLQGDVLMVSFIIQNNRPTPLDTAINLNGDLPSMRIMHHDPEQFDAFGGYGAVSLHGYNEFHNPTSQPVLPILLQSDTFHLKPGERQSFTTMWILSQ